MGDDDTAHFGAEIDREVAELVNERLEYGERSKYIRQLAETLAYGDRVDDRTPVDATIERKEQELADARHERRQIDERIETLEDELDQLRERRESIQTTEDRLEASLIPIEDDLRRGMNVDPEAPPVKRVAREYNLTPDAVVAELQNRNPDVPPHAFEKQTVNPTKSWSGVPTAEINTPVENRDERYRDRD